MFLLVRQIHPRASAGGNAGWPSAAGGLLMVQEAGNSYLPAYDALGNVHAMIKASDGSLAAAYEYDAFGQTLRESGPYAASNPFRFATKYTDIETGLVQYNTRYYSPSLGRFINRDTIGEAGGLNLYAYVANNAVNRFDVLGRNMYSEKYARERPSMNVVEKLNVPQSEWINGYFEPIGITDEGEVLLHNHVPRTANPGVLGLVLGVVASVLTYGALSGPAASFAAGLGFSAPAAPIVGGALAGASSGVVSQVVSTGSFDNLGDAALSGAIMGGVGGHYGNNWSAGRVVTTSVAGGVVSEINGGDFADGALLSGGIAAVTYGALEMREAMVEQSRLDQSGVNSGGKSVGFNGDEFKLGGGRFNPGATRQIPSTLGGVQGGPGQVGPFPYSPGSIADRVVEAYAGPHDFLNNPWWYDAGTGNIRTDLSGLQRAAGNVMNWVNVPLATPVVATSVVGISPGATTAVLLNRTQQNNRGSNWPPGG